MPSYQATPTESTVSHVATNRSRSSRVSRNEASDRVIAYSSSTSSLSQTAPPPDSRASTLVDQGGGVRGEEPQPVVLNSMYIDGTGWASQVSKWMGLSFLLIWGKTVTVLLPIGVFFVFFLAVFWWCVGAVQWWLPVEDTAFWWQHCCTEVYQPPRTGVKVWTVLLLCLWQCMFHTCTSETHGWSKDGLAHQTTLCTLH